MKINEIMSHSVVSVKPEDSVSTAAQLMKEHDIGAIPVVQGEQIKGIITDRDIVLRCIAEQQDASGLQAQKVMSPHVTTVKPDDSVDFALTRMSEFQVQRLPVVDGGRLAGMLSLSDIARQNVYEEISEAVAEIKMQS
ncbi:MAG: CBS domain-containing protein [Oscillospiraceae bacterium]|nr:CBS domain-containing protein [Oscillospiraceae bacterium]